jgi:hypothetical protein
MDKLIRGDMTADLMLSAGEIIAAFAAENGLARIQEHVRAARYLAAETFQSAMDSSCASRPSAGARGGALSSKVEE